MRVNIENYSYCLKEHLRVHYPVENYAYVNFKVSVLLLIILYLLVLTVLCKPWMFKHLINCETAVRVLDQAPSDTILSFFAYQLPAGQVKH